LLIVPIIIIIIIIIIIVHYVFTNTQAESCYWSVLIHTSLCVLNFVVPACRPNFAKVASPVFKVNCAGETEISCPLVTQKARAWERRYPEGTDGSHVDPKVGANCICKYNQL